MHITHDSNEILALSYDSSKTFVFFLVVDGNFKHKIGIAICRPEIWSVGQNIVFRMRSCKKSVAQSSVIAGNHSRGRSPAVAIVAENRGLKVQILSQSATPPFSNPQLTLITFTGVVYRITDEGNDKDKIFDGICCPEIRLRSVFQEQF